MKERILDALINHFQQPVFDYVLEDYLEVSEQDKGLFYSTLEELAATGAVVATKKKKCGTPEMFDMIIGKVDIAQRGFGFLVVPGQKGNDIFLPEPELEGVFQGDQLLVKIVKRSADGRRREVHPQVVHRARHDFSGRRALGVRRVVQHWAEPCPVHDGEAGIHRNERQQVDGRRRAEESNRDVAEIHGHPRGRSG